MGSDGEEDYRKLARWRHRGRELSLIDDSDVFFFFSSRRRHTRFDCDWSSDVCSSDLVRVCTELRITDRDGVAGALTEWCESGDGPNPMFEAARTAEAEAGRLLAEAQEIGRASCRERV